MIARIYGLPMSPAVIRDAALKRKTGRPQAALSPWQELALTVCMDDPVELSRRRLRTGCSRPMPLSIAAPVSADIVEEAADLIASLIAAFPGGVPFLAPCLRP